MAKKLTVAQRQNADVKVGTIKPGAAGRKANQWNGKRWVAVTGSRTGYPTSMGSSKAKPAPPRKPATAKSAARDASAGRRSMATATASRASADSAGRKARVAQSARSTSGTVTSAIAKGKSSNGPASGYSRGNTNPGGYRKETYPGGEAARLAAKRKADNSPEGTKKALTAIAPLYGPAAVAAGMAVGGGGAAAAGARAIGAGGRKALPAGRQAIGASGRVVKSTSPTVGKATLTDLRTATSRGVSSGQVPRAAIGRGTAAQRATAARTAKDRVQTQAAGSGVHPETGGPATRVGNPAKVNRPLRPTVTQGKKLQAQAAAASRSAAAKKAAATRKANAGRAQSKMGTK